jgi:hypothetical protein
MVFQSTGSGFEIRCLLSHHQAILDVSAFADDCSGAWLGPRMVCTVCGVVGAGRMIIFSVTDD